MFNKGPHKTEGEMFWITRRVQDMVKVSTGCLRAELRVVNVDAKRRVIQATDGNCLAVHPLPKEYKGPSFSFSLSGRVMRKNQCALVMKEDLLNKEGKLRIGREVILKVDQEGKPLPGVIIMTIQDPRTFPNTENLFINLKKEDYTYSISVNLVYIEKVIKAIGTKCVTIHLPNDGLNPLFFSGSVNQETDPTMLMEMSSDHCGVIMPMRSTDVIITPPERLEEWKKQASK